MKMLIEKLYGNTKATKRFTPTIFIFTESGQVYADNSEIGFFKHPKTKAEICEHIINLICEGFTTKNITTKELTLYYNKLINEGRF